jgi:four helix bundle protein
VVFEFEKLEVYAQGREFRKRIYKLAKLLPKDEFKLKVQMRDAARSLTNNLAEGHGRYTFKERGRFCRDSRGSLQELVDDVNICIDEEYAKVEHLETLRTDAARLLKLINGYTAYLKRCAANQVKRKTQSTTPAKSQLTQLT